ncbi:MAG: clostripain-related cysteine peptidase [Candidatus Heimdallarchaeota archaeon]
MNYKKIKPIFILVLVTSILLIPEIDLKGKNASERITYKLEPEANKKWTYMIYSCGDTRQEVVTNSSDNSQNTLNANMLEAMTEIVESDLLAGSEVDLNVIVLHDYPYQPSKPNGYAFIYELKAASVGGRTEVAEWGVTNMGDGQTLDDFVAFCKTYYPADNFALSLVDHGRAYAGHCFDYHAPHPYVQYAIGDCLSLNEIEAALSGTNNVDMIIMNTCLGGNFELAWQLMDEADYMLGGETTLGSTPLLSPRDYCYNLSRDPDLTPREFAEMAFAVSVDPIRLANWRFWGTCSLYDISQFPVAGLGTPFTVAFDEFVESLHDELDYNISQRDTFKWIRSGMGTTGMAPSSAMLVDLKDCVEKIHGNQSLFHEPSVGTSAGVLLGLLNPGPNEVLLDVFNDWDENHTYPATYLQGFNFCFPDSHDMYKGFLYGNMYSGLKINSDTRWNEFLDRLYPKVSIDKYKLKDFYEIQLFEIDPSIKLDVIFEVSPAEIYHVGQNINFPESHMGIEIGIQGAEYQDDFYGNFMIRIPTAGLAVGGALNKADGAETFQVIIDASYAASATQDVNLTVKHITDDEVVWEESQTYDIQIGQKLITDITTDDEMSDFVVTEIPTNKFGYTSTSSLVLITMLSFVLFIQIFSRRRKRSF